MRVPAAATFANTGLGYIHERERPAQATKIYHRILHRRRRMI